MSDCNKANPKSMLLDRFLEMVSTYMEETNDTVRTLTEALFALYITEKKLSSRTRTQIAEKAGVNYRHLERIEKRTVVPTLDTLIRLIEACDMKVEVCVYRVGDNEKRDILKDTVDTISSYLRNRQGKKTLFIAEDNS